MVDLYPERLLVRDREGLRQWKATDDWAWLVLAGAISDDPRSFDELARACRRFSENSWLEDLPWENACGAVAGPWLLFDLACRRVVAGGGAQAPERKGAFQSTPGPREPEDQVVWLNMPPHWERIEDAQWKDALPPIPEARTPLDVRSILFGRPLAEGIARRTLELARNEELPKTRHRRDAGREAPNEAAKAWHALTVKVHADWLMTPRKDLNGEPPRAFLHKAINWVSRELQNRQSQWSLRKRAPRPLDRDTFAYRYGPLGTHEVVVYFELCREVIATAWERISEDSGIQEAALAEALDGRAKWWMAKGRMEDSAAESPSEIVEYERRRIPLIAGSGPLFDDCPMCRMLAESDPEAMGPMFCNIDGHHLELEDEFAFSLCATREEWEQQQASYRDWSDGSECGENQGEGSQSEDEPFESVWKTSYVNEEAAGRAGISADALLNLATRMCELVGDLKAAGAGTETIEALNAAFDLYRAADLDPVLTRTTASQLKTQLEKLAAEHPAMIPKVADFQSQLDARERRQEQPDIPS